MTLFNRGKTNPHLFPELEKIEGNREEGIEALEAAVAAGKELGRRDRHLGLRALATSRPAPRCSRLTPDSTSSSPPSASTPITRVPADETSAVAQADEEWVAGVEDDPRVAGELRRDEGALRAGGRGGDAGPGDQHPAGPDRRTDGPLRPLHLLGRARRPGRGGARAGRRQRPGATGRRARPGHLDAGLHRAEDHRRLQRHLACRPIQHGRDALRHQGRLHHRRPLHLGHSRVPHRERRGRLDEPAGLAARQWRDCRVPSRQHREGGGGRAEVPSPGGDRSRHGCLVRRGPAGRLRLRRTRAPGCPAPGRRSCWPPGTPGLRTRRPP